MSSIAVLAQYGSTAASLIRLGARRFRGLVPADIILGGLAAATTLVVVSGAHWKELARAAAVMAAGAVLRMVVVYRGNQRSA
jgi:mannose/fructose/N-acetylgalactosamine-specific phosphotransferase system component IIC